MDAENLLRLDVALPARGLCPSRERAQSLIRAGLVAVNGRPCAKPSTKISEADSVELLGTDYPYVSRGGLKLEKALRVFGADPSELVCVDVGASTGGFTDVLLRGGARKVYAVDVGAGQLSAALAADPRVVSMEHTNARTLSADMFPEPPSLAVMDVSFISVKLILPALFQLLGENGRVLSLIKPQFEAGPQALGKKGVVGDARIHEQVLAQLCEFVPTLGWRVRALDFSPVCGGDGNLEFLADLVPSNGTAQPFVDRVEIRRLVAQAHREIR